MDAVGWPNVMLGTRTGATGQDTTTFQLTSHLSPSVEMSY